MHSFPHTSRHSSADFSTSQIKIDSQVPQALLLLGSNTVKVLPPILTIRNGCSVARHLGCVHSGQIGSSRSLTVDFQHNAALRLFD